MSALKVTKSNHLPGTGDERFKVFSKQFNELVDYVNDAVGTPGTGEFDIISEETAAAGVTVDGVLLKDSQVTTDVVNEKTAAAGVTVDGVLIKDGGVSNAGGTILAGFYPIGAQQTLSGPGAVNLTSYFTHFTSTGTGDALTLANGSQKGQLKQITYIAEAAGGDTGVLTLTGYTSITFNAVWDEVLLIWTGAAWIVIGTSGVTIV